MLQHLAALIRYLYVSESRREIYRTIRRKLVAVACDSVCFGHFATSN